MTLRPYLTVITTRAELAAIANDLAGTCVLGADIDLADNLSASAFGALTGFAAFLDEYDIPTDTDPMTVTNDIPLAARYV